MQTDGNFARNLKNRSSEGSDSDTMELRDRTTDKRERDSNSEDSADDTKENLGLQDDKKAKKKAKSELKTVIKLRVSFGGRRCAGATVDSEPDFYESVSRGATSDTIHAQKETLTIEEPHGTLSFAQHILPAVIRVLKTLPTPVEFEEESHKIYKPRLYENGDITRVLDATGTRQAYHLLAPLDETSWEALGTSFELSLCILPSSMSDRPPTVSKEKPIAGLVQSPGLMVNVCHGGVLHNGNYLSDRSSGAAGGRKTVSLGSKRIAYPINRQKLVEVADELMRHGAMLCAFSEEVHILRREQPITKPSGKSGKKGTVPELPEAVAIGPTFSIDDSYTGPTLVVIVFEKGMPESSSGGVVGGSHASGSLEDTFTAAKSKIVSWLVVEMRKGRTNTLDYAKGFVLEGGITTSATYESSAFDLVNWTQKQIESHVLESDKSIKGLLRMMVEYLKNLPRDQATSNSLPSSVSVAGFAKTPPPPAPKQPTACSSKEAAFQELFAGDDDGQYDAVRFKCRLKGSALASQALTITAMKTAKERKIQLEIEVVEDCGTGGKYKAETWLGVKQIDDYDSPTNPSTFVVEIVELVGLASSQSKTRLRFQHFEIRPESDNDAIELESDNDAVALEE